MTFGKQVHSCKGSQVEWSQLAIHWQATWFLNHKQFTHFVSPSVAFETGQNICQWKKGETTTAAVKTMDLHRDKNWWWEDQAWVLPHFIYFWSVTNKLAKLTRYICRVSFRPSRLWSTISSLGSSPGAPAQYWSTVGPLCLWQCSTLHLIGIDLMWTW